MWTAENHPNSLSAGGAVNRQRAPERSLRSVIGLALPQAFACALPSEARARMLRIPLRVTIWLSHPVRIGGSCASCLPPTHVVNLLIKGLLTPSLRQISRPIQSWQELSKSLNPSCFSLPAPQCQGAERL
jgi:hypothetical protein